MHGYNIEHHETLMLLITNLYYCLFSFEAARFLQNPKTTYFKPDGVDHYDEFQICLGYESYVVYIFVPKILEHASSGDYFKLCYAESWLLFYLNAKLFVHYCHVYACDYAKLFLVYYWQMLLYNHFINKRLILCNTCMCCHKSITNVTIAICFNHLATHICVTINPIKMLP